MSDFEWSDKAVRAAELLAEGKLTYNQIVADLDIGRMTFWRWREHPQFMARVEEHLDEFREAVRRRGLAVLERRVDSLNDRWDRLHQIMNARAADPERASVPGWTSGLMVRNLKGIGKGKDFRVVETYEVDRGLLSEMREHEKQAAQELGQWVERKHVETRDLAAAEGFDRKIAELAARAGATGVPEQPEPAGQG